MAWVILEGLDRTGKSTVAELYKKKGYEVVHMSAPDKKYREAGYAGPSYLDDILDMYMKYDNADVIFDRSVYGEFVWPYVYGREPSLSEDDLEVLQEFEERNSCKKILMCDPDTQAHWQRCVDNKEPMTFPQFKVAISLFTKLAHKHGFIPMQLKDFEHETKNTKPTSTPSKQEEPVKVGQDKASGPSLLPSLPEEVQQPAAETELEKLEKANAIRDILAKRVLKQKGGTFDQLEEDIRNFLRVQLSSIFKEQSSRPSLTEEEVTVLKVFCQRLKEKETVRK